MYKVLVIAYYFPPMGLSGVQRTLKFTKYMKNFNWEPTVLTASNTGYYAHDMSLMAEAEAANIRIVRTKGGDINSLLSKKGTMKMPPEFIRKVLSRISSTFLLPDNKKGWAKEAIKTARELLNNENFDLIFVSAPPFSAINMAVKLKKEFNIPLVIDYRDLWFGNQFAFYATPIHKLIHKRMEYVALKAADKVIATNRKMKEKMINWYKFLSFEDIFIIPQGFDPEDFLNIVPEKRENNKMRIAYSGIFYEFITPKYFFRAFKELTIERPDIACNIELHFLGFLRNENKKIIRKLGLQEFIKEFGYLDHKAALVKIMSTDVLWLMVGNARNVDTHSAGKLYEYFGTKKPIIACLPEGALKTAVEDYKAGFITKYDDIQAIKNAILNAYLLYTSNQLPEPDLDFVEKHRRDFLTEQLTKQFQFLVKEEVI
jgi:glycosyltransferase involved in cell wall biosynthesis